MNIFCSTREMVERLKDIVSTHWLDEKVYDKDVAVLLNIEHSNLATKIKRDRPPLKEILLFCDRCGLDPFKILLKKKNC
ncbi:MAG: hypothetical protein GQ570_02710 [Helicobacteraceae bacterium]|nr:hypothetical protein [Helicobacteraceae bacterium]